jgi:hypothetical protein
MLDLRVENLGRFERALRWTIRCDERQTKSGKTGSNIHLGHPIIPRE